MNTAPNSSNQGLMHLIKKLISLHPVWMVLFWLTAVTVMLLDQACNFFRHGCFPHYLGHSVLEQGKPVGKPRLAMEKIFWISWSKNRLNILEEQRTKNRTFLQRIPHMKILHAVKCFHRGDDIFYNFTRHM